MDNIESHRSHGRANERALRTTSLPNLTDENSEVTDSCLAVAVNAELVTNSSLTINSDFLCPIAQLIPEDAVIFAGKLYERSSADAYIRDSLTKLLPRTVRGPRCVKDPLNPLNIIYSCQNRIPIIDDSELLRIINSLIRDVDDGWCLKLKEDLRIELHQ